MTSNEQVSRAHSDELPSGRKDYVLAVQAPACRLDDGTFATESAFAVHLKMLWAELRSDFDRLVLLAPEADRNEYDRHPERFGVLSERKDRICFVPAYKLDASVRQFWSNEALPLWRRLGTTLSTASYLHSGLASSLWKPYLFFVNTRAFFKKVPSTFVVDIDFRRMSYRRYRSGMWSLKSYVVNRVLHDTFKRAQLWFAVRSSKLLLLKSPSMVDAYGDGRPYVKDFLDAAHGDADVVSEAELADRLAQRERAAGPLQITYFGRFVEYKGLDLALDAIETANTRGADVRLTLIGDGEIIDRLRTRASSPALSSVVTFLPTVPYGQRVFELIDAADITIASPKGEDTPRAALDSMARGLPVLAFDIDYFANLSEKSGAVILGAWLSADALADQLVALSRDRKRVADMARKAVAFARLNSQEIWLERRMRWTQTAYRGESF